MCIGRIKHYNPWLYFSNIETTTRIKVSIMADGLDIGAEIEEQIVCQ